jgi:signal transduction histidine kinase
VPSSRRIGFLTAGWPKSLVDPGAVRNRALTLVANGGVVGLVAEWLALATGPRDVAEGPWLLALDLATGWVIYGAGLVAWQRRPALRVGPALLLAGLAWFGANAAWPLAAGMRDVVGAPATEFVVAELLYLHRGPLVYALLVYPALHLTSHRRLALGAGLVAALAGPIWQAPWGTIVLCALLAAVLAARHLRVTGPDHATRLLGARAGIAFASVVALGALVRLGLPPGQAWEWALVAYELTLAGVAITLVLGLIVMPLREPMIADIVVELGRGAPATLRDALADALGDPNVEVGFAVAGGTRYVDAYGLPLPLPSPGSNRGSTRIDRNGEAVAIIVHDRAVLEDRELAAAVSMAGSLAAANAELHGRVADHLADLYASRRRLVEAGDAERRRLEERLRAGPGQRMAELRSLLGSARTARAEELAKSAHHLERADVHLEATVRDLEVLAQGLHPRALVEGGLGKALAELAEANPVPVEARLAAEHIPLDLQASIYFVCAEALANIAKHSRATRGSIDVRGSGDRVLIEISDDGVGGATIGKGSGLQGLIDRVAAQGGVLTIDSPLGGGTRLRAVVPVKRPPDDGLSRRHDPNLGPALASDPVASTDDAASKSRAASDLSGRGRSYRRSQRRSTGGPR